MRLQQAARLIEDFDYPITTHELIESAGNQVLTYPDGAETLEQILSRTEPETFGSSQDLQLTLYASLCEDAIGRKRYSDRDPPSGTEVEHISF